MSWWRWLPSSTVSGAGMSSKLQHAAIKQGTSGSYIWGGST
jgi:hypothetical protein